MNYLYLDTSHHLVVGLLNHSLEWLELREVPTQRSSGIVHQVIVDVLHEFQQGPQALAGIIEAAGPGSYTGIRLAHGIAEVFQWQGVAAYGFYHFDVARLLGEEQGWWAVRAFKGEVLIYRWQGGSEGQAALSPEVDFVQLCQEPSTQGALYSHSPQLLSALGPLPEIHSTHQMIKDNPGSFFRCILERKVKCCPYYFRSQEREFKRPRL